MLNYGYFQKIHQELKHIKSNLRTLKRDQVAIQKQMGKQTSYKGPKTLPVIKQNLPRLTLPGKLVTCSIVIKRVRIGFEFVSNHANPR